MNLDESQDHKYHCWSQYWVHVIHAFSHLVDVSYQDKHTIYIIYVLFRIC